MCGAANLFIKTPGGLLRDGDFKAQGWFTTSPFLSSTYNNQEKLRELWL